MSFEYFPSFCVLLFFFLWAFITWQHYENLSKHKLGEKKELFHFYKDIFISFVDLLSSYSNITVVSHSHHSFPQSTNAPSHTSTLKNKTKTTTCHTTKWMNFSLSMLINLPTSTSPLLSLTAYLIFFNTFASSLITFHFFFLNTTFAVVVFRDTK